MSMTQKVLFSFVALLAASNIWPGDCYKPVSIIQLVATPEANINQAIRVKGYLAFGTSSRIFLTHDSARVGDVSSSIAIIDQTENGDLIELCNERYVILSGRFVEFRNNYEITDIQEVIDIENKESCWVKNP